MPLATLTHALQAVWRPDDPTHFIPHLAVGFETRTNPRAYSWHGLKRGADPLHPNVLFQYTLEGLGQYDSPALAKPLTPGTALTAVFPSHHHYYLPPSPAPPRWRFFWIVLSHPYAVARIIERQRAAGPVWTIPPDSLLVARALALVQGVRQNTFRDPFAAEHAIFDFLIEHERFGHQLLHPQTQRESLLQEVRDDVLARLHRPLTVAALAARHAMSRSHFSHHFTARTGLTPAQFITDLRLAEVTRRLLTTHDTLYAIARHTGFADANHLCKVFKRKHHLSPGAFRKQMR